MPDADPVLAAWAKHDPSDQGWPQAQKAIEAYKAGDLAEASWRAQAVRDAWGEHWSPLGEALWAAHSESETGGMGFGRKPTRLKRCLDAVANRVRPIGRAVDFLGNTLDGITFLILIILFVVAGGIECVRCVNAPDESDADQAHVEPSEAAGIGSDEAARPVGVE